MDIRTQPLDVDDTTNTNPFVNMHMFSSGVAGPSTVPSGRDAGDQYYEPMAEFVDVMFNSGSSSNSNMDLIFSTATEDHKWDSTGDNKQD